MTVRTYRDRHTASYRQAASDAFRLAERPHGVDDTAHDRGVFCHCELPVVHYPVEVNQHSEPGDELLDPLVLGFERIL